MVIQQHSRIHVDQPPTVRGMLPLLPHRSVSPAEPKLKRATCYKQTVSLLIILVGVHRIVHRGAGKVGLVRLVALEPSSSRLMEQAAVFVRASRFSANHIDVLLFTATVLV